jgi:AraC-like DNA-binding protein
MMALEAALQGRNLYRNPELSLDRLARKLVIPARRISGAVNRVRGMNVSQYVNEHRVRDACRRLAETDDPVTQIMFEAGFQTKSNFNREFLRVTGKSPSAWRAENGPARLGVAKNGPVASPPSVGAKPGGGFSSDISGSAQPGNSRH